MYFNLPILVLLCLIVFSVASIEGAKTERVTDDSRFLVFNGTTGISFTTFTVLKASTTITSTLTSTTSCTTSTATLTTCTIGRRRRGLFYDDASTQGRNRRGLFYNDDEADNKDGTVFLPSLIKGSDNPVDELQPKLAVDETSVIPLVIEPGFELPEGSPVNRFLVAFGTNTVTSYTIATSTVTLTAICSSTTGFPLCGNVGK
ncbi:uncharacterized protein LOC124199504 [Daphnia pulex]|uniref:uncharacterized protein LOC124199504 n=1 Tax=Daphnia pulex TaxID=6669 RepID=UPI001EDCBBA6|nr:uncharacterized protein LOC124199504 [Daphnia pulex]